MNMLRKVELTYKHHIRQFKTFFKIKNWDSATFLTSSGQRENWVFLPKTSDREGSRRDMAMIFYFWVFKDIWHLLEKESCESKHNSQIYWLLKIDFFGKIWPCVRFGFFWWLFSKKVNLSMILVVLFLDISNLCRFWSKQAFTMIFWPRRRL